MANVLGALSFLDTPDVNGALVLTDLTGVNSVLGVANEITVTGTAPALSVGLADNLIAPGTGSLTVPSGTTAQRPTPTVGMIRYNSTTGYFETYDTTWTQLTGIIDKSSTLTTFTGTAANTVVSYSVPGGTLGTTGIIRLNVGGIWNNAAGANRTITMSITYGGTTMWSSTSSNLSSGSTIAWKLEFYLMANNSATAQTLSGHVALSSVTAPTTGTGTLANTTAIPFNSNPIGGTSAINSGIAQNLNFVCTMSGATTTLTKYFHTIELL